MQSQKRWKIGQFAALIGVSVSTLQRWDRAGILKAGRTPTGRRVYTERHFQYVTQSKDKGAR